MTEEPKTMSQLESELWNMANELRGNMSASEFQNYILGFMFYRYLSGHQKKYLIDQNPMGADGDIYAAYLAIPDTDIVDYLTDTASVLGYAIRPEFTWDILIHNIDSKQLSPSYFQDMFDDFEKNAEMNKQSAQDFRNIFADMNLNNSRLGNSNASRVKALSSIASMIEEIGLNDDGGRDVLGNVYEYLISQFAADSGKKAGEFYTPHEVSEVLAKLVTLDAPDTGTFSVYDPTMGSGSLLLTVQNELKNGHEKGRVHFYGQELNTTTYNLARMNLMMHDVDYQNMNLRNADTLESDWPDGAVDGINRPRSFDAVVANPPYSAHWDNNDSKRKDPRFKGYKKLAPKTKADYAFVLHSLYHLNSDGTMAIVLPHGVLFRGAAEGDIRQSIIENNYLDAVIGMPAGLFYSTSIPTVILVFKKNRGSRKDIFFIDASNNFEKGKNQNKLRQEDIDKIISTYAKREGVDKYAHVANPDEIKENEYNLNIPRYVDTFEEPEPIDIDAVKAEIADIDKQIAEAEKEFAELESQLVRTDDNE